MQALMMLTDLADACRKSGLRVIERPGWKSRGKGPMSNVRTIVVHHDVTPTRLIDGALGYIEANTLSQLVLGRDGTVHVVASGRCHHAGVVHHADQGNSYAIGIEAAHSGNPRDPYPGVQYDAYVRLCAALVTHYGLPVSRVQGHKEVARPTGRKTDPTFNMTAFRKAVARAARTEPGPATWTLGDRVLYVTNPQMTGGDVRRVQRWAGLTGDDVDGHYGPDTAAAVRAAQAAAGLDVDGRVGPATVRHILNPPEPQPVRPEPIPTPEPEDDEMPTADDIAKAVWGWQMPDLAAADQKPRTAGSHLQVTRRHAALGLRPDATILAAVKAAALEQGADADRLAADVQRLLDEAARLAAPE